MPKLKNSLIAGVLYISIIAILYGFTLTMFKTISDPFIPGDVEMQEMGSFLAASTLSNTSSGSSWHQEGSVATMAGATHTTASTAVDNIAISQLSGTIDEFGYPRRDPRIDPSLDTNLPHWENKHRSPWLTKFKRGHTPSIGSSGEIDNISMYSRPAPSNQPHFKLPENRLTESGVSTSGSIIVPSLTDPRYYR